MIGQQLDLFGGPPKPPKKIRIQPEEPAAAAPSGPADDGSVSVIPPVAEALSATTHTVQVTADTPEPDGNSNENPVVAGSGDAAGESTQPAKTKSAQAEDHEQSVTDDGLPQLNIPADADLFKRQYYTMRETAAMFDVNQSLLRYWENEFDVLKPKKNKKGDRYFRPVDIKNLQLIYHLLRHRKFTIEGAKEYLRNRNKALDTFDLVQRLEKLKSFLHELKAHL